MIAADYLSQLQALLPVGLAWPREPDSTLTKLLAGWADEFARLDTRAMRLIEEADPRTTEELLPDWERVLGLPDPCMPDGAGLQQRRAAVTARLTGIGGQSRVYFIGLAADLGVEITITELQPFRCGTGECGDTIFDPEVVFTWQVNLPADVARVVQFRMGESTAGERLLEMDVGALECLFSRLKPAHTQVVFASPED